MENGFWSNLLEEMSSGCAVYKNNVGNVVSEADGMRDIWRKYMEKLLNVENDWDGEVHYSDMMGPCCLILEEVVAAAIKVITIGNAAGPIGLVGEMMRHLVGIIVVCSFQPSSSLIQLRRVWKSQFSYRLDRSVP